MPEIHILDNGTIDKIAAGEVVDRPASVVKELVENAIDAGATAVTVDVKQGGIALIRVTDNGTGIAKEQITKAFLRHATSKITSVEDLSKCQSLGFRGEALSSIAAVSMVEFITKQKEHLMGVRYVLEGAVQKEMEDIGAPDGTTIMVRNLFFNTPARRKFLKTPQTEASYISELMEHLAMSKPEISFKYVINGQLKFHTSGNGELKEIIYRIYGKDITKELLPIHYASEHVTMSGFIGKPTINRSNRNFENFFVNHRYIKSDLIGKAVEEAFRPYLMQHKFPFAIIHFEMNPENIDVNVHPTKMEIRFSNQHEVYQVVMDKVTETLSMKELIPEVTIDMPKIPPKSTDIQEIRIEPILSDLDVEGYEAHVNYKTSQESVEQAHHQSRTAPEPFEVNRKQADCVMETASYTIDQPTTPKDKNHAEGVGLYYNKSEMNIETEEKTNEKKELKEFLTNTVLGKNTIGSIQNGSNIIKSKDHILVERHTQLNMFDDKLLTKEARENYQILGQLFDTYWLIAYSDKLYIMDQHAAHEKVKYEALLKKIQEKGVTSQNINPPVILTLSSKEDTTLKEYRAYFKGVGFEIEDFGGNEYALRSVPADLFGCNEKELFQDIMDELMESNISANPQVVEEKLASMACKAAVKGNNSLTREEVGSLLDQLLELENPYHCPHGRPTIISMSKYEIEKKFKRIV
ncbi:MAG: DNA mismatch repair endonuclease MutL [Lachnospiraceae bacterium]|nr:DNA mismatch repair endonuclease MutL [Lachnospiraceae bacterium]